MVAASLLLVALILDVGRLAHRGPWSFRRGACSLTKASSTGAGTSGSSVLSRIAAVGDRGRLHRALGPSTGLISVGGGRDLGPFRRTTGGNLLGVRVECRQDGDQVARCRVGALSRPPWWFIDAPEPSAAYRAAITEAADFVKNSGFIDDTRASCSIPARHDMSGGVGRRVRGPVARRFPAPLPLASRHSGRSAGADRAARCGQLPSGPSAWYTGTVPTRISGASPPSPAEAPS
jgi:hypothetical protein